MKESEIKYCLICSKAIHKPLWNRICDYKQRKYHKECWNKSRIKTDLYKLQKLIKNNRIKKLNALKCKFCEVKDKLTVDHIIPLSLGGTDESNNLQILCLSCNRKKGNNL